MIQIKRFGLDRFLFKDITSEFHTFEKFCVEQLTARMQAKDSESKKDFFHYLEAATDPETGEKATMAQLANELNTLLLAGKHSQLTSPTDDRLSLDHSCQIQAQTPSP